MILEHVIIRSNSYIFMLDIMLNMYYNESNLKLETQKRRYEMSRGRRANNRWTCVDCLRIIKENKDETAWFNYELSMDYMWEMLRQRMGFGEAETAVIIAALIRAGAKFR